LAVSFPPDTTVLDIVEWWHGVTCQKFLVPQALGDRKVTLFSFGIMLFEDAHDLFLALLRSVGLTLVPAGRFQRVNTAAGVEEPAHKVFPRLSLEQVKVVAVVTSQTRPFALLQGPGEKKRIVTRGDYIGRGALRIAEIQSDRLVLEASGSASVDQSPAAPHSLTLRAVQPDPLWKIGAGALGSPGMR